MKEKRKNIRKGVGLSEMDRKTKGKEEEVVLRWKGRQRREFDDVLDKIINRKIDIRGMKFRLKAERWLRLGGEI